MLNKYDIGLIVVVVILAGAMALVLGKGISKVSDQLVISVNGKLYNVYDSNEDQTIRIDIEGRHNVVEIKDSKVKMIEANCSDKYCLKKGSITQGKESIVCLPNRVMVEFKETTSNVDTIVE